MKLFKKWFRKKERERPFCSAIVLAAGSATRMEGVDKIMLELGGIPVIVHSLRPFEESSLIQEIVVVTRRESLVDIGRLCKDYGFTKVTKILPGGSTRMASVQKGLVEVNRAAELIAIHDGARPFVTREVAEEAILRAQATGAAAPGIPVKDTIKLTEQGMVRQTLPRESLVAIQTPQVFEASLIRAALAKALHDGAALTDDCSAVERLGFPVAVTTGSEENIKLTTPDDLILGEAILAGRNWY